MQILEDYLASKPLKNLNAQMTAFVANLDLVAQSNREIARSIVSELSDQRTFLKLIASENFCTLNIQAAMGNLLTDKYAEGFVGHRFYAGCENVDNIEQIACENAKLLFNCQHAYVQPHSGADANLVAFWAILRKKVQSPFLEKLSEKNLLNLSKQQWDQLRSLLGNQKLLGMDLYAGGHLTHGYRHNVSAQMFDVYSYGVNRESGLLDYDEIHQKLLEIKPLVFLVGFSAYTRNVNYALLKKFANEVGAVLMVDMAHFAGLVAGGVLEGDYNPIPFADIVTSTTHKTLRGPRGGLVLCKKDFAEFVDKGCPHVLGGPLPHIMAAKAIAFSEANTKEFKAYAHQIVENSRELAKSLQEHGIFVQTGGTDNHMILIDVSKMDLTGRQAESALRECSMTLNRNALPFDQNGAWYTSGLRLGTAALTTLGMGKAEMQEIGSIIAETLKKVVPLNENGTKSKAKYILDDETKETSKSRVKQILKRFVLYPELDLEFLKKYFD